MAIACPGLYLQVDDATTVEYATWLPLAAEYGLVGTLYVITGLVGTTNYMTWAQIGEFAAAGWAIGNHTHTHRDLRTLSLAEQEAEFATARDLLIANGHSAGARHVAYPYGQRDANTLTALTSTGMLTGRGVGAPGNNPLYCPPANFYTAVYGGSMDSTLSVETAVTQLDAAISGLYLYHTLFHNLDGSGTWTTANVEAFLTEWKTREATAPAFTITEYYYRATTALPVAGVRLETGALLMLETPA